MNNISINKDTGYLNIVSMYNILIENKPAVYRGRKVLKNRQVTLLNTRPERIAGIAGNNKTISQHNQ